MSKPELSLLTIDYPPRTGGVATYLRSLVNASQGGVHVIADERMLFSKIWPHWWPMIHVCIQEMRSKRIVFVSHVFPVGTAALLAQWICGGEYVLLFHGLDLRLARTSWKRWLLCSICESAKELIVNSEATKRELVRLVPDVQPLILLPAIEQPQLLTRQGARECLGLKADEKIVLTISRLVSRKGIDKALEAMARIQQDRMVRYVVLGDGPDFKRLEELSMKYETSVDWIRHANDEHKHLWLAAANLFLLPARDEGNDMEGFGMVFLEAAWAGLPSIAGRSGGVAEAVIDGKTGLLVDPTSVDEIVEALDSLLKDSEWAQTMGELGKQRVRQDFQWSDRWRRLSEKIYLRP